MRILVIDGEIEVANLIAQAIQEQGHETTVAHDGEEGLALLGQHRPDAVFLDVLLPEMSGLEVLRRIRMAHPALPVILLTGQAPSEELQEAHRLGVTEILEKPSVLTRLREALAGLKGSGHR